MEVVKRIIADVLYRHLGNYVDGLTKESIGNGIWEGNLELRALRLRAESLAILFENFGLDLPVTVTAGYVGLLCVEVPWTQLQSMPVRIILTDVAVVASPVSDGEQKDLSVREKRLKCARLATDESVRDVKFSLRNAPAEKAPTDTASTDGIENPTAESNASSGWRFGFGLNWWKRYVMRIVDNIQIEIKNVIVQYEDSSSVRGNPYTCSLALDSLSASAADNLWKKAFNVELAPVVHKIAQLEGLVLNWAPGTDGNELKSWIDSSSERHPGRWAGYVRACNRHAIEPMNGELRVSMVRPSALAEALSSTDPSKEWLKNRPRVEMDLHIPDIAVCLDDFNYHTLLSTVMYLSDIDRRVRPTTAKGRWRWAVDRLLPRFIERRKATMLLHDPEKLKERRELREEYIMARNSVVTARRKGRRENQEHVAIIERIEDQVSYEDVLLFRDMADRILLKDQNSRSSPKGWSLWSPFKHARTKPRTEVSELDASSEQPPAELGEFDSEQKDANSPDGDGSERNTPREGEPEAGVMSRAQSTNSEILSAPQLSSTDIDSIPRLRMAFLLERGAIKLSRGGFPEPSFPLVSLEFSELRLGITTAGATNGFMVEAVLGAFEALDLKKGTKFWYARLPRSNVETKSGMLSSSSSQDEFLDARDSVSNNDDVSAEWESIPKTTDRSYPSEVTSALRAIRSERGAIRGSTSSLFHGSGDGSSPSGMEIAIDDPSSSAPPLKYIAALRISEECSNAHPDSEESEDPERPRLAMDLSIGGMEVILDGPECAFISTVSFWSPREKLPSIMAFLNRSEAPRLAFLRMEVQKAILEHKEPMRMDLHVRAPRFIIAPVQDDTSSIVVDLGTFAMETSTGPPQLLQLQSSPSKTKAAPGSSTCVPKKRSSVRHCEVQYTDYLMSFSDLGVFLVSGEKNQVAERLVKPFSLALSLQVLHNPSYVEALTSHLERVDFSKVKLSMTLSTLITSISHKAFRQVLAVIRTWSNVSTVAEDADMSEKSQSVTGTVEEELEFGVDRIISLKEPEAVSALVSFEMHVQLEKLKLELRDSNRHRIVTVSSTGTECGYKRRQEVAELSYQVHTFAVTDGSRGATAPYQCLAYAGSRSDIGVRLGNCDILGSSSSSSGNLMEDYDEGKAFVSVSYVGDLKTHEQTISVEVLSLHLVCVRETYLALADFFYLVENYKESSGPTKGPSRRRDSPSDAAQSQDDAQGQYADPFNALGMTTVSVARKFREKANIGMEMSKQALANRGKLVVTAALDGVGVVLVSGEGAIATFEVGDCKSRLTQMPCGSVEASGQLGRFLVKDLTAAYEIYSNAVEYNRAAEPDRNVDGSNVDGWTLRIPQDGAGDPWLIARLRNLKVVYVQRFVVILRKYFGVLRENLRPVLEIKGGIAEVFDDDIMENLSALAQRESRLRLNCITENINVIIPRHSQSPHEALRFIVGHSAVTNEDEPAPGYKLGIQICTGDVKGYVLYDDTGGYRGEEDTQDDIPLKSIEPFGSVSDLVPFTENGFISAKLDLWRRRRVPKVIVNSEGVPVLKDGEEERKYDPTMWKPMLRVRVCAPKGLTADLCEAQYSILYFCFTENLIERPDIEFTDIVRGLKTPVLPPRKPIRPIMLSSHRMPPNYQVLFEVPFLASTIMHGSNPLDKSSKLIQTELRNITGLFEYGVDYRMSVEVSGSLHSLVDIRPHAVMPNATIISSAPKSEPTAEDQSSITLNWDRPHGYRANVMVVVSDIRVVVVPELFRDLGLLTTPGFPYLNSSAPAPFLRFNGRQLILTVSRPEVWLMAHQYPGDDRSLVLRGDVIAKVQWAAVTGRNTFELAAHGLSMNLSNRAPQLSALLNATSNDLGGSTRNRADDEVPLLYPSDISLKHQGSGYDPPTTPGGEPIKAPGAELTVNAESLLLRVDVNDIPLILAIGSRLGRLRPSVLSDRPPQPGRFDEWLDKGEKGDAKLFAVVSVPHARLIFTDELSGYYVPIMELRVGNAVVRSNVWITNAKFEFSIDLFNDEKGWWEPGIEPFSFEVAVSRGKSGSEAVQLRAEQTINANITPTTVSGAFRVVDTLKRAIEDRIVSLKTGVEEYPASAYVSDIRQSIVDSQRPSVAAFCVRNETGRSVSLWLPYDSLRRSLKGNGGESEIETPTEDLLWSAVSMNGSSFERMDGNRDRRLSMQCTIAMNGYDPVSLSAAEVGSRIIYLFPEASNNSKHNESNRESIQGCLTLVWSVSMRNGVPVGCLRSLFRIVNETRTVFGIKLGRNIQNTESSSPATSMEDSRYSQDSALGADDNPIWIKAGESWSVPVQSVESTIRIRPIVLEAPNVDSDEPNNDHLDSPAGRSRVVYKYHWSDPLSKFSSLLESGLKLEPILRGEETAKSPNSPANKPSNVPSLSCRSVHHGNPFTVLLIPRVGFSSHLDLLQTGGKAVHWVDVVVRAPFLVSNSLPRPVSFAIANTRQLKLNEISTFDVKEWIEPLRTVHVHTAGTDLSHLSVGMGYDNCPVTDLGSSILNSLRKTRNVPGVHRDLGHIAGIPVGSHGDGNCKFLARIDRALSGVSQRLTLFSEFWIRNRSSSDLMFKNSSGNTEVLSSDVQEIFLRSRPPGTLADKYIAFSGSWIAFRTVTDQCEWKPMGTDVLDMERPVAFALGKVSLIAEVRPARGEFHRTLIVTIRNAMWIENRTDVTFLWCQPAALDSGGNALVSHVHVSEPGSCAPLNWDFEKESKDICLRRAESDVSSDWIWSRPIAVQGKEGDFAAKMYRPRRHEQYIARVAVTRLAGGVGAVVIHKEDRNTPPYRIVNLCKNRSVAFRQNGVQEKSPWLVRPGKSTRYSWDDPQSPLRRRCLVVEVIEVVSSNHNRFGATRSMSTGALDPREAEDGPDGPQMYYEVKRAGGLKEIRHPTFNLNIDIIQDEVDFQHSKRFKPPLQISVHVDGPTKVVTFTDAPSEVIGSTNSTNENAKHVDSLSPGQRKPPKYGEIVDAPDSEPVETVTRKTLDVKLWVKALGLSFVDSTPTELAYLTVTGVHFRLDRFDGQQLIVCEVQDVQLDNQLPQAAWPVAIWSPAHDVSSGTPNSNSRPSVRRGNERKPFFELTIDGEYPHVKNGIGFFRGIYVALQQIQVNADEDFVLRGWAWIRSLLAATGSSVDSMVENLTMNDGEEIGMTKLITASVEDEVRNDEADSSSGLINRLYVTNLELCPVKVTVSFIPSRASSTSTRSRSVVRTLVAVLGNVQNAEFRFNALELQHVFDSVAHFQSLIAEFYVSQCSSQKITLLTSNSIIGNPSALFDSIAIGAKDFFYEPAKAKGSADFIVSIGRGSSSLLTNTVGGLVGSIGEIPRAVAHGLETAVGDKDYLAERESIRGGRARSVTTPAQGLFNGALSFGHGIASGAAGLIRDPVQGAVEEGASGFMKGLRKGVIGGVLKPITGALDLIAEPAAGFRNFMVSDRNKFFSEPIRPSRTFLGSHRDRLALYDFNLALGSIILQELNGSDSTGKSERLLSWVDFTARSPVLENESVDGFLWALIRKSTRSPNAGRGQLSDVHGVVQRADKIRAGLVTTRRVIVTTLNGHIVWEHPLVDVVSTQASVESRDYLSIGVRPVGSFNHAVPPKWEKIHCGAVSSRDAFNVALKKALADFGLTKARQRAAIYGMDSDSFVAAAGISATSFEMVDLSSAGQSASKSVSETQKGMEMKSLHSDASVDGRRGVFTEMSMPGRTMPGRSSSNSKLNFTNDDDLARQVKAIMRVPDTDLVNSVRSVRIVVVNRLSVELRLVRSAMESGSWVVAVPSSIAPNSVVVLKASATEDKVKDVAGSFVYQVFQESQAGKPDLIIALRFVNPLLAVNAYAIDMPDNVCVTRLGGEKGDHAQTVLSISGNDGYSIMPSQSRPTKLSNSLESPLLFGRGDSPTIVPDARPPHAPPVVTGDPDDPELITKLSSLGFSRSDAHRALKLENANVSKAYARLIRLTNTSTSNLT